jgi:hypothetical protein
VNTKISTGALLIGVSWLVLLLTTLSFDRRFGFIVISIEVFVLGLVFVAAALFARK